MGFYNERFFIVLCISLIFSNGLGTFLQVTYLNQSIPLSFFQVFNSFAPVALFQWLFGQMTFFQFYITVHLFFTAACFFAAIFFSIFQLFVVVNGLTSYEVSKKANPFSRSSKLDNLRSVFGDLKWIPLQFIYPFGVNQIDDGINWNIRKRVKGT